MNKNKPRSQKTAEPSNKAISKTQAVAFLQRHEIFFSAHRNALLAATLILSLVFGLFLFDVKISEGNDDSMYIESGYFFARDFTGFYTANAPLYPMFLSIFIRLFGVKLILLKFVSLGFSLANLFLLYRIFRNRIPYSVLMPVLLLTGMNSYYLYFASQTYTEAFFSLLQTTFIGSVFAVHDKLQCENNLLSSWKEWSFLGMSFLLLTLCKNVAIASVPAAILFFLLQKNFKAAAFSILAIGAIRGIFELVKGAVWKSSNQFANQSTLLLQKDPYNADKGQEDISGFIDRFFGNVDLYISKRFYQILGFRSPDETTVNSALSFITILILIFAFVIIFKRKNRYLLFTGIYAVTMAGLTFLVLQTRWDQPRYLMVYVHLILIVFLFGLYGWLEKKNSFLQRLYPVAVFILVSSSVLASLNKGVKNYPTLKKNLAGDIYHGFSPDYVNYLKLSKWCADSLPANSYIAARKAPMSFIYSNGKEFFPIYSATSSDPDTVLSLFKKNNVSHVILANLRRDPKKQDGYIINTLHRMVQPVAQKYPGKVKFVKRIGETEPADLYEIIY